MFQFLRCKYVSRGKFSCKFFSIVQFHVPDTMENAYQLICMEKERVVLNCNLFFSLIDNYDEEKNIVKSSRFVQEKRFTTITMKIEKNR